jgi:hypothetical protein
VEAPSIIHSGVQHAERLAKSLKRGFSREKFDHGSAYRAYRRSEHECRCAGILTAI